MKHFTIGVLLGTGATLIAIGLFLVPGSGNSKTKQSLIHYTKDEQTGLCFGILYGEPGYNMSRPVSMVCVPCDSLKNVLK